MLCNHIDPATWLHHDGNSFCPGCKRFMGRVGAQSEKSKRSRTAADVDADDDRGLFFNEGESDGETESEEA